MSFSGISRVKNSASIFVDKEKRGISDSTAHSSVYRNVEYVLDASYTLDENASYSRNSSSIVVKQTLSNPTANYENLNFAFISVESSNTRQTSDNLIGSQRSIVVDNGLSYSYTKNIGAKNNTSVSIVNVLSTNTEHNITINLDGESLPEVETLYQNYEVANDIELSEDEVWS